MLYVPARFAHWGVSMDDECMTYSIGFRAPNLQVSSRTTSPVPLPLGLLLPLAFLLPSLAIKSCVLAAHSDGRAASGGTLAQEPLPATRFQPRSIWIYSVRHKFWIFLELSRTIQSRRKPACNRFLFLTLSVWWCYCLDALVWGDGDRKECGGMVRTCDADTKLCVGMLTTCEGDRT